MKARAWLFWAALATAAAACLFYLWPEPALAPRDLAGLATFIGLAVFAEAMAHIFKVDRAGQAKSSVAYLPLFACVVTFPTFWTVLAGAITSSTSDIVHRHRPWVAAFNSSLYAVALTGAAAVYRLLGGHSISSGGLSIAAFFGMAATFFLIDLLVLAAFVRVRSGEKFVVTLSGIIGPTGANLFYDMLASPIALASAWLYYRLYLGGLIIVVLPLLLVRYSFLYARQYRQVNKDLMRVLVKAIETRDPYTSGHSVRVAAIARIIATDMHLPRRKADMLETAALLHDIGKIEALYASIINKPHDLTPNERAVIRTHAVKGADMLLELSAFQQEDIIKGVRHHHERFDGNGYPAGLRGADIPLPARIIMIGDAIDAMLSDRPYRPALDPESVKRELVRCSGEQFDPEIVRLILEHRTVERARDLLRQIPPGVVPRPAVIVAGLSK